MNHPTGMALLAAALCLAQPARAMDFRLTGHLIHGTGDIVAGDTERLAALLKKDASSGPDDDYVLQLAGAGGDAAEAVRLGRSLRSAQISTVIAHDSSCLGACALAFLGGTQSYATGVGIGRVLEFGGKLGFGGVVVANSPGAGPAGTAPVSIATLASYAAELRGIDVGRLTLLATGEAGEPATVNQPRDILALSIVLRDVPARTPADWATNACTVVVGKHLPALDDAADRVTGTATVIPSVQALRRAVMSGRTDDAPVAHALAALADADAMDLALGAPFYLDQRRPILDARSIDLQRGAGFYYDTCLAVRSKTMLAVILLDGVSHRAVLEDFEEDRALLAMAGQRTGLW